MAVYLNKNIKGRELLKEEVDFLSQIDKNKKVIKVGVLNLMPNFEDTERDLLRVLDVKGLQVEVDFIVLNKDKKNEYKKKYLNKCYYAFDDIKNKNYDGMIVTGAPLEHFRYEDISFKEDLKEFMDYTKEHVKSTIFLCFASEIAIDYFYGVKRHSLGSKLSGLFKNYIVNETKLVKNFDDSFLVPVSRYCGINEEEVLLNNNLILVSKGTYSGVFIVESKDSKQIFITGHLEYSKDTLDKEYKRDLSECLNPSKPLNYYLGNKINYNCIVS